MREGGEGGEGRGRDSTHRIPFDVRCNYVVHVRLEFSPMSI